MTIKSIVVGRWYKTSQGIGQAMRVGGTHPPSVQMRITHPFPRGVVYLAPRDVERELTSDEQSKLLGATAERKE